MNSGKADNAENEKKFHAFEAQLKSLVDTIKFSEAIDYYEKNSSISHHIRGDSCTFYSFRIMGVCRSKDIRNFWYKKGYRPSHWMTEGDRLFDTGDYPGAIEAYYKAVDTDSDKAHYAMGCAHRAMGNPYESVEEWDKAAAIMAKDRNADTLTENPDDAPAWAAQGEVEYNQENWDSAISAFNNSLALDPGQPKLWFRKGCSHFERREYRDALAAFQKTLDFTPDHSGAENNIAATLKGLGQNDRVMEYLDRAAQHCTPGSMEHHLIEENKKRISSGEQKGNPLAIFC